MCDRATYEKYEYYKKIADYFTTVAIVAIMVSGACFVAYLVYLNSMKTLSVTDCRFVESFRGVNYYTCGKDIGK